MDNFKYLTSEQALADLANFIESMNRQRNLNGRKWIIFGGELFKLLFFKYSMNIHLIIHTPLIIRSSTPQTFFSNLFNKLTSQFPVINYSYFLLLNNHIKLKIKY